MPLSLINPISNPAISGNLNVSGNTTLNGNVNIDSNTLFVNSSNNRIGIGTNNPTQPLDVVGNLNVSGGIIPSSPFSFRNKIINGNFDFWQRGTSFTQTTSSGYTADRWTSVFNGSGGTRIISRQTFTVGQTEVPNNPKYFLRINQSVAGSGATFNVLSHRVEGVETLAGRTATFSFWIRSGATLTCPGIVVAQIFGTGGSPNASVGTSSFSVTTAWTKFSFTVNIPSIIGKTIGTNGDDFLVTDFYLPLNTTFTIDIAQVQLEEGSVATPFEVRPLGLELNLCHRYYEELNFNDGARLNLGLLVYHAGTNSILGVYHYKVKKRRNPTITYSGNWRYLGLSQGGNANNLFAGDINTMQFQFGSSTDGSTSLSGYTNLLQGSDAGNARLIIDAEF